MYLYIIVMYFSIIYSYVKMLTANSSRGGIITCWRTDIFGAPGKVPLWASGVRQHFLCAGAREGLAWGRRTMLDHRKCSQTSSGCSQASSTGCSQASSIVYVHAPSVGACLIQIFVYIYIYICNIKIHIYIYIYIYI